VKLSELAKETHYSPDEITYFFRMLHEIAGKEFVAALCQAAYDVGLEDGYENAEMVFNADDDYSGKCMGI